MFWFQLLHTTPFSPWLLPFSDTSLLDRRLHFPLYYLTFLDILPMKHGSAFDQKVFADILADILDTSKESLKERVPATWSLYSLGFLQHLKLSIYIECNLTVQYVHTSIVTLVLRILDPLARGGLKKHLFLHIKLDLPRLGTPNTKEQ